MGLTCSKIEDSIGLFRATLRSRDRLYLIPDPTNVEKTHMALCALAEVSNLPLAPPGATIGNTPVLLRWNERETTTNMDGSNETGSDTPHRWDGHAKFAQ